MKLKKILIKNFRKLKNNIELDIIQETLIVGKNNTGKTSLSELIQKFLTVHKVFKFEDFSSSSVKIENINGIIDKFYAMGMILMRKILKNYFLLLLWKSILK